MNKLVLVTGGLGYIGSHTVVELLQKGYDVEIIDNYSNSSHATLKRIEAITGKAVKFKWLDLRNFNSLHAYFTEVNPAYIIHFAALKSVEESVEKSLKYYENNVMGLVNLLKAITTTSADISRFVFSSSCAVYDKNAPMPVTETTAVSSNPSSPYSATKIFCEKILTDWGVNHNIEVDLLRYFNPVGAHESGLLGEIQKTKRNLFPIMMDAVYTGKTITVCGSDYDTPDGTCIRDYIHVSDLAEGHIAAMEHQRSKSADLISTYNFGSGNGTSVNDIIDACVRVLNLPVSRKIGPRRSGDLPAIWADTCYTENTLNFKPKRNLETMVRTAWDWERNYQEETTISKQDNLFITNG